MEIECELGAARLDTGPMQMAAVSFDDLPAQSGDQSHAFRLCRLKWFKQMFRNLRRNASTVVLNANASNAIPKTEPNRDESLAVAALGCGIYGIRNTGLAAPVRSESARLEQ